MLSGAEPSVCSTSDIIGVMPEPAAMPTTRPPVPGGRWETNRPSGLITSSVIPGARWSIAHGENSPPMSRLMPTLSDPATGAWQIE